MIVVGGALAAFFLWMLGRTLSKPERKVVPCRGCWRECYWNGSDYVHTDGTKYAPYSPPIWVDPTDESKGQDMHPAGPVLDLSTL